MYHSIIFKDRSLNVTYDIWNEWHLIPTERPHIAPPALKFRQVEVPGSNGSIDLTESLTKYPLYNNRSGSIDFIVLNDGYWQYPENSSYNWIDVYTSIMTHIHGKQLDMFLEDDPDYYYRGRFVVNDWKTDKAHSTITLDYNVEPFKWLDASPSELYPSILKNITVNDSIWTDVTLDNTHGTVYYGPAPTCPIIKAYSGSSNVYVRIGFVNTLLGATTHYVNIPCGTQQNPTIYSAKQFVMAGTQSIFHMKTTTENTQAVVTIDYRKGTF